MDTKLNATFIDGLVPTEWRFPPDIFLVICTSLCSRRFHKTLSSLCLLSSAAYGFASKWLYFSPFFDVITPMEQFHSTLIRRPDLIPLVQRFGVSLIGNNLISKSVWNLVRSIVQTCKNLEAIWLDQTRGCTDFTAIAELHSAIMSKPLKSVCFGSCQHFDLSDLFQVCPDLEHLWLTNFDPNTFNLAIKPSQRPSLRVFQLVFKASAAPGLQQLSHSCSLLRVVDICLLTTPDSPRASIPQVVEFLVQLASLEDLTLDAGNLDSDLADFDPGRAIMLACTSLRRLQISGQLLKETSFTPDGGRRIFALNLSCTQRFGLQETTSLMILRKDYLPKLCQIRLTQGSQAQGPWKAMNTRAFEKLCGRYEVRCDLKKEVVWLKRWNEQVSAVEDRLAIFHQWL